MTAFQKVFLNTDSSLQLETGQLSIPEDSLGLQFTLIVTPC